MTDHLISQAINLRAKILEKKYFHLGKNYPVVTSSYSDDVTTKHFLAKILDFKAYEKLEPALQIFLNIWQTI